ncbi:MAG: zinc-ribbon domain-containing protein [Deltaproteobacteria bacterium]|nr:zinc-ribbon domain-containing protein [Deltaproteobacteria bacterium]
MKFYCDQCNAQYFIADEKIGAKGVKVRCKRCDNVIIIRPPAPEEEPAAVSPSVDSDLFGGSDALSDEPAPSSSEAPSPSETPDSGLGDFGLDLEGNPDLGQDNLDLPASTADSGMEGDSLLAAGDDDEIYSKDNATISESAGEPAAVEAPVARSAPASIAASSALASEDALDSELAGAFDSVFGAAPVDPFNTVEISGAPDRSKRETKFYSPREMAQVEQEKINAYDNGNGDSISETIADGVGYHSQTGGNGEGELGDDLLAPSQTSPPPEAEGDLDREPIWYVAIDEQQVGPMSLADLNDRWDRGEVNVDSLIWKSSLTDWMPIRDVVDLRSFVASKSKKPRRDLLSSAATEVERPHNPLGFDALDAAAAMDAQSFLGNVSLPSDSMNDPFATVESNDDLAPPEGAVSGSWRPHGMTEIYQAASLAEASAMQPPPSPEQPVEEDIDWNPGAAAALASLVDEEIKSVATNPSAGGLLPTADDNDLRLAPEGKEAYDGLLAKAPLPVPSSIGALPTADPFAAQVSSAGAADVDIAQIAGQSSMVMQRPSFLTEQPRSERKINWLLWGGIGAGGLFLLIMFVLLIVVLVKLFTPAPQPVVAAATTMVPPGTPAQPGGPGDQALQPVNPTPTPATPASQPTAAEQVPTTPSPPIDSNGDSAAKESKQGRTGTGRKPAVDWNKKRTATTGGNDSTPATNTDVKPPPSRGSGDCDPILYPDGNCPGSSGGSGALAATAAPVKTKRSKSDILSGIKKNLPSIKACAAEQAKRDKRLATGELKMSWYIRPDGKTKNVAIMTSKFKGTYIGECVTNAISKWQFPAIDGEEAGPIRFPFPLE